MPGQYKLSGKEARRLALISQGLHQRKPFGHGLDGVARAIRQLGYVQLDTISVVNRAHHHILWSRVPDYKLNALYELQETHRRIFEYWSHAAAFLPIEDYRFTLPQVQLFRDGKDGWPNVEKKVKKLVMERIREEGPLMARDFQSSGKKPSGSWWEWRPAKLALQRLFFEGELMARHRKGFQRVYDLTERVLPGDVDTRMPSTDDYADYLIRQTLRAQGLAAASQMSYLRRGMGKPVINRLKALEEDGQVVQVRYPGMQQQYFALPESLEHVSGKRLMQSMRILSPFDNCVIQRKRTLELFAFDYQIECYVPGPKRKYGYFCLPLQFGDRLVGRIDAKADRKAGILRIIHLFLEHSMAEDLFVAACIPAIQRFAKFHDCPEIRVENTTPDSLKPAMISLL